MSVAEQEVLERLREQRLLEDVIALVQRWDGRPPHSALDAVLARTGAGDGHVELPSQRRRRRS